MQGDKLIVASFGKLPDEGQKPELGGLARRRSRGPVGEQARRGDPIGNLDGLQALEPGIYLVTDWAAGGLYRVGAKGKAERLIKLNKGSADFVYLRRQEDGADPDHAEQRARRLHARLADAPHHAAVDADAHAPVVAEAASLQR